MEEKETCEKKRREKEVGAQRMSERGESERACVSQRERERENRFLCQ